MKYGQENEKNALAAVIGGLLPAFLPNCFSFLEVGPSFISVFGEENFMEVSPDGLLRCMVGEECTNRNMPEHSSPVPIEAKCIYSDQSKLVEPMYQIIQRYVPQTLVEMAIYKVLVLWLISFTEISTVFMKVSFKEVLWLQMRKIAHDLHGGEKPKVLTKLHPDTKKLKVSIQAFVQTNCTFVCEIPSYFGVEGILRESEILSPYSYCNLRIPNSLDLASAERQLKTICVEVKPLFQDIQNTLCQEVQEVLVFMLSDHNRHHEEFVPYSLPLGYAMKGKHLSNNELCFLVDECRRKLKERGIPILCEVYDGQWQNLCMTDKDGNPLMELRLVKNTWQRVSKMSKNKCLQELILGAKVKKRDLEMMEKSEHLENGSTTYHNLKISRNEDFLLKALSTGGLTFSEPAINYIRSVTTKSRPDLW